MRNAWRAALLGTALAIPAAGYADPPRQLDQGPRWDDAARTAFYSQDQGSRLIPLAWLRALRQPDGQGFLADGLARYGYLANPASPEALPVGFTTGGWRGQTYAAMTCSACHTRDIALGGATYRVDGAPAFADFGLFLHDLDHAVANTLADPAAFGAFAAAILGGTPNDAAKAALRQQVEDWDKPFTTIVNRAVPVPGWGPGRLDAVGMILNRVTGLDIGTAPDHIIADNIRLADAPERYPFVWNASLQDKTQWPGFADNGNDILALARNLGEVYGVFGRFHPQPWSVWNGIDYKSQNSAVFSGLDAVEQSIKRIGPPKWPFYIDADLAARGAVIYGQGTDPGQCAACHGIKPGISRFLAKTTWATPVQSVGTDTREYRTLAWTAQTGTLNGAYIPFVATQRLAATDLSFNVLKTSVIGAILEHYDPLATGRSTSGFYPSLPGAFHQEVAEAPKPAFESRVLQGIWAAAPYLHNGSVPTLAALLEPPDKRPASFKIGPAYDLQNVGLAKDQPGVTQTLVTTGCDDLDSGNSRCGHLFGTTLSAKDKQALLEYLKTL